MTGDIFLHAPALLAAANAIATGKRCRCWWCWGCRAGGKWTRRLPTSPLMLIDHITRHSSRLLLQLCAETSVSSMAYGASAYSVSKPFFPIVQVALLFVVVFVFVLSTSCAVFLLQQLTNIQCHDRLRIYDNSVNVFRPNISMMYPPVFNSYFQSIVLSVLL